ncbi:hypothetical protein GCM10009030_30970 [Haloarcula pellucida]|uniref:DUF302 domain-containing protein n=1 Tax=Haloarcula pellucida TaxID=1427151 RepID=A0A830GN25_9EURY|nr:hypothetical protein GCM10009030_30970 [Halomicroarcula pellucida]
MRATLQVKLRDDFRDDRILGACNPSLVHEALEAELELGALLPCNVTVYDEGGDGVGDSAVDPAARTGAVSLKATTPGSPATDPSSSRCHVVRPR